MRFGGNHKTQYKARVPDQIQQAELQTLDGRIWFNQGHPGYDENGTFLGGIETCLEITECKKVENALQESDAYNTVLFQETRTAIVVWDPSTGRFTDCNTAAIEICTYQDRDEVIGLNPLDVSAPFQYDGTDSAIAV